MKKNKSNLRLPVSYVLTYLLIFIIPFSIISLIFYYNSVNSLRKETELSNIHTLNNIKSIVDSRMKELSNIGALISYDSTLTPYWVNNKDYSPEATTNLKKYKEISSIIDELYLFYYEQDNVLSNKGHMEINTFLEYQTVLEDTTKEDLIYHLSNIHYQTLSTNLRPFGSAPTFLYPLPPGTGGKYGMILMKLEKSFFENMINNILGSYDGNVLIFDQNNQPIATFTKHSTELSLTDLQDILANDPGIFEIAVDNITFSIVTVKSEISGWTYVMALPTHQFFSKVSEFKTFMLLVLIFIAIVASVFTVYVALKNYHPIKKMIDIVKNKDTSLQFNSKNDLDNLSTILEKLYTEQDVLNDKYSKQEPLIRDHCLITLLKGQNKQMNQAYELLKSLKLDFSGPHSFVVVTSLPSEQLRDIDMKELELEIHRVFPSTHVYGVELISENVLALIVIGEIPSQSDKQVVLEHLENQLSTTASFCLGVGKTYSGKNFIHHSFIEASAAFEYGTTNQLSTIVHFEEIKEQQETIWLPRTELLKLTQSCKQGNIEIAKETLNRLITWLETGSAPVHLETHMKYDLLNTLIKIASETGISINLKNVYYKIEETTLQQFQETLSNIIHEICIKIEHKKEEQKNKLQEDIFQHIHNHYQDYQLSLENIAKDFNLSSSYLSRFIKEETGKTFSQYVWELRLEEVKKQLIETDQPIKDIISNVGYIDAPNFTRKFKKNVGLTPSEFRNVYSKGT